MNYSDQATFMHWVKADVTYPDYPYAKYNIRPDAVSYSDEEYEELLHSPTWTRSETDHLMYLCSKYELRWPVIVDRYTAVPPRSCEDLQVRYYYVVSKINSSRTNASDAQLTNEAFTILDPDMERRRRMQQESMLRRENNNAAELKALRDELKLVDGQLKKAKKVKQDSQPKTTTSNSNNNTGSSSSGSSSRNNGGDEEVLKEQIIIPPPQRTKPSLQSSRLVVVEQTPGLTQSMGQKANWMLRELGVPDYPMPTRAVCDMLDHVRKNVVSLLSIQNAIHLKERELSSLSANGSGVGGSGSDRKRSQEVVIPHSMTAARGNEYRPAPIPIQLTQSSSDQVSQQQRKINQAGGGVGSQKRRAGEMDATALGGGVSNSVGGGGGSDMIAPTGSGVSLGLQGSGQRVIKRRR